ncbi:MAG: HNH endonuclease [Deltaproteobacteria bacterium]|nr:HNH endonuclease [Deltaproteobacteria bacterium]
MNAAIPSQPTTLLTPVAPKPRALLIELARHAASSFETTADVLRVLGEVDRTDAWTERPYGSLFSFCLGELNWSEGEAAKKIQAARAARRFPLLLDRVRAGRLHLAGVVLLAAKLDDENARSLIDAACGKSKREIEALLAARFPRPDVAPSIRKLPAPLRGVVAETPSLPLSSAAPLVREAPAGGKTSARTPTVAKPDRRADVAPLSAERHKLTVTISSATRDRLARLAALTSHRGPEARSVEGLLDAALELLEAKLVKERFGVGAKPRKVQAPKKSARAFSKADRRAIVARDGLQCSHVDAATGVRCSETRWLTLDHVEPWAVGGASVAENGRVLCSAHNQAAARRVLGEELVRKRVEERQLRRVGVMGDAALPRRGDAGDAGGVDGLGTGWGQPAARPAPEPAPEAAHTPLDNSAFPAAGGATPSCPHRLENPEDRRPGGRRPRGFPHLHGAYGCWLSTEQSPGGLPHCFTLQSPGTVA